jgi:hypothetical protein
MIEKLKAVNYLIPERLHLYIKLNAAKNGRSMEEYCCLLLDKGVKAEVKEGKENG